MTSTVEPTPYDEGIDLLDIYEFLRDGWRVIVGFAVAGLGIAIGAVLLTPARYEAVANIDSARVLGNPVESNAVLAEKMRSPTYYSAKTLQTCTVAGSPNAGAVLTKALNPNVPRQSSFVAVSHKAPSPEAASDCLLAVLEDVNRNQGEISAPQIEQARARIKKDEEKLKLAEDFVASFASRSKAGQFDFNDAKFSASSLLIVTLQGKQAEITELKNSIQAAKLALAEPQTKQASFPTPIYAPGLRSGPARSVILAVGLMAGVMVGILALAAARGWTALQRRAGQKAEQAAPGQ